jgi:hypothetical protein
MCTVTYLPSETGYILTSNRDEKNKRKPASQPIEYPLGNNLLLFPRDGESGGTWLATDQNGITVCLLNGAFEAHFSNPPYRQSRGKVVLDYFQFTDFQSFLNEYSLDGIEPFTLIVANKKGHPVLEIRWDGDRKYVKMHPEDKPVIWSSSTLYSPDVIKLREKWFSEWRSKNPNWNQTDILNFHKFSGSGESENSLVMSRGIVLKTQSITSVEVDGKNSRMEHFDITTNNQSTRQLVHQISTKTVEIS